MNIFLWILQIILGFWNITGAAYMQGHYQDLATEAAFAALPHAFWLVFAAIQILLAIGIVVPKMGAVPSWTTTVSATGLAILSLASIGLFSAYAGFPGLLWGVLPAAAAAYVAYKRW
jgi:hypothetical protein